MRRRGGRHAHQTAAVGLIAQRAVARRPRARSGRSVRLRTRRSSAGPLRRLVCPLCSGRVARATRGANLGRVVAEGIFQVDARVLALENGDGTSLPLCKERFRAGAISEGGGSSACLISIAGDRELVTDELGASIAMSGRQGSRSPASLRRNEHARIEHRSHGVSGSAGWFLAIPSTASK